jgi:hypothetical protein
MPTYAVLGLGARAVDFRDHHAAFPGGKIGWIRWRDMEVYPVTVDSPPGTSDDPDDEQRLDYSPLAGRFTITTEQAGEPGVELATAVADGMAGILALHFPGLDLAITPALDPEWLEQGEVWFERLQDRDEDIIPFGVPPELRSAASLDTEIHARASSTGSSLCYAAHTGGSRDRSLRRCITA